MNRAADSSAEMASVCEGSGRRRWGVSGLASYPRAGRTVAARQSLPDEQLDVDPRISAMLYDLPPFEIGLATPQADAQPKTFPFRIHLAHPARRVREFVCSRWSWCLSNP